jgi:hypothetical protein
MGKYSPSQGYMEVSKNGGTPKSFIVTGFSIIHHPAIGDLPFMETPIWVCLKIEHTPLLWPFK